MKKVLASLLTAYVLTNGQAPPVVEQAVITPAPVLLTVEAPGNSANAPGQQTPAPVTPEPAPVIEAPINTPAPVEPAAPGNSANAPGQQTPAPVTPEPAPVITPAPIITPAPVTPAPVTPAPTLNPYCPLNAGEQSGIQPLPRNENKVCFAPYEVVTDYQGTLRCTSFSCCQCAQINCGFSGFPCDTLKIGDSGAVGVQSINIRGVAAYSPNNVLNNIFGGSFGGNNNGAMLECAGREACRASRIRAEAIGGAQCSGDAGCQSAHITINDPVQGMNFQCNGMASCQAARVEINVGVLEAANMPPGQGCNPAYSGVTELGTIEFNGLESGAQTEMIIRNEGCGTLLIQNFECLSTEACPGIAVEIIGNVAITNCDLVGVAPNNPNIQSLVRACQAGANFNANPIPPPMPVVPAPPAQWQPTPVVPANPVFPPQTVPAPPSPVNPFPAQPVVPASPQQPSPVVPVPVFPAYPAPASANAAKLVCDSPVPSSARNCANKHMTIQISNNFVLECSQPHVCSGLTLTLNAGYDPNNPILTTTRIDSFKFYGAQQGVTIYVNNDFGTFGSPVRVNDLRCEGPYTCSGLTIVGGPGVDVFGTNFDCNDATSCIGCNARSGAQSMDCMAAQWPQWGAQPQLPTVPQWGAPVAPPAVPANPGNFPPQTMPANPWV